MLEVFINFICAFLLVLLGFFTINKILNLEVKLSLRIILILIINSIIIDLIHYYNYNLPILNFIINTITYKIIFNISLEDSILLTGIFSLFILLSELIGMFLLIVVIPLYKYSNNSIIYLINNLIVIGIALLLMKSNYIKNSLYKIYLTLSKKELHLNVIFTFIIVLLASCIIYKVFINYKIDSKVIIDLIVIGGLLVLGIIFTNSRDTYNRLSKEYDILLSNIKNFEEWVENEQYLRHEYKNQLAILYSLSSEKKVKDKIEEIINQNLNIKNKTIYELKDLPKGELKGLLYYKTIIAQNDKINLTIDSSIKSKGILSKLSKQKINSLAKIIGIYYDNAIEAAKESRKKIILLEIYELKDKVNIVISNTYKKNSIIKNNELKGVSSKGKGRGNGLYFANKILRNNEWIKEKHEIIDNYYIETISILKSTSK